MPRRVCFYHRCKNAELEAFYKARTGKNVHVTQKKLTKKELGDLLRKIDRRPWKYGNRFRFLDLPPEMRDLIYRELLPVNPQPDQKCQLSILRVCKQTHSEAHSILYGDHDGDITLRTDASNWANATIFDRSISLFSKNIHNSASSTSRLRHICQNWPSYLLHFSKINIRVDLKSHSTALTELPGGMKVSTNQELSSLVSFLSESTKLKTLQVTVELVPSLSQESDLLIALEPLARIGSKTTLDLVGVSKEIKETILLQKETMPDTKHFLADFFETRTKFTELNDFQASIDPENSLFPLIVVPDICLANALDTSTVVDEKAEAMLKEVTKEVKAFLAGEIAQKLDHLAKQKVKEIKKESTKKVKEVKEEAAKKVDEVQGLQAKFKGFKEDLKETTTPAVASA